MAWCFFVVMLACFCGCGAAPTPPETANVQRDLRTLVVLYQQYASEHRGTPPKDLDAFKKYVETQKEYAAQFSGGFDPAKAFVSPRDQQPYVWLLGPRTKTPRGQAPGASRSSGEVLAYEKVGHDGKRMVAFATSSVQEMSEEEFRKYVAQGSGEG